MRAFTLLVWIMILVINFLPLSTEAGKFDKNYVIYYTFDKGKGNQVKDIGKQGNHGKLMDGAKREAKGKFGSGIKFGAGNSYIETIVDVPENKFTMA